MARSLWKGKAFIKEFIKPSYQLSNINYLKSLKPLKITRVATSNLDELKIYRRNHLVINSQISMIRSLSHYFLYNGYDFIKRSIYPVLGDNDTQPILNLATTVSTREMQVTHKIKLSKAARKSNAKLKKRTSVLTKSTASNGIVKKKVSFSKKIKK